MKSIATVAIRITKKILGKNVSFTIAFARGGWYGALTFNMEETSMGTGLMEPTFKTQKLNMNSLPILAKQKLDSTQLPELYRKAKIALKQCAQIDEVKDIQDKHSAIAHYAKQAKDKSLLYYAERIQLRAFMRLGVLLAALPDTTTSKEVVDEFGVAYITQKQAGEAQHIPAKVLDTLIDSSEKPPTKKRLADVGYGYVHTKIGKYNQSTARGLATLRAKEAKIKPTARDQGKNLVDYLESVKLDLECFLTDDGFTTKYTMKRLAEELVPEEDLATDYHHDTLLPVINMLAQFREFFPEK